jgi:hypothetical protein
MYRRLLIFCALIWCIFSVQAQEPVQRNLEPFSGLVVGDKIIVRLVKAEKESALIQVQGIDESAVKTVMAGNTLELSIYGEPFTRKKVTVTLNYVHLNSIAVTGGADVSTTSLFKSDNLTVDLKSGGMLYLDADIEKLSGKILEGALLTGEGYATTMDLIVSTSASLSAFDLECETVTLKVNSGGKAKVNVETELNAEVSSKGYISYKGNPSKINKNVLSGGTISAYKP